jgi:hypothetical protein
MHLVEAALGGQPTFIPKPGQSNQKTISFFHDFSSPYSYLASTQIQALADDWGVQLELRPMLLGALFKAIGPIYQWRIRARIYRWYKHLREIDQQLYSGKLNGDIDAEIARLEKLEDELAKVRTRVEASFLRGLDTNGGLASQLTYFQASVGDWRYVVTHPQRVRLESDNYDLLLANAVAGNGVLHTPLWSVASHLADGRLVRLMADYQIEPDAFGEDILAVYPSHRRATGKVQAFIDYLQRFLAFTLEADR